MPVDATSPLPDALKASVFTVTLNPAIDRTLTVPGFTAGEVNRAASSTDKAGGKGVNVAIALALAGTPVTAGGLLGAANRQLFSSTFANLGIADAFTLLAGETRTGIKIVDPLSHQTTDINFPGLQPQPEQLEQVGNWLLNAVRQAATPPWVALSGSLPPTVSEHIYAQWTTRLQAAGARVLLDTSGKALHHGITAAPALIKPNKDELQELLGTKLGSIAAVADAARELIRRHGIRIVAVSMGAEGVCLVSAESAVHAPTVPIPIHSTVGAGDAMVAGMLHALHTADATALTTPYGNEALANIARHGTAFSLATLQQPQTLEPAAFRARIAHWLPQVTVSPL